MSIPAPGMLQFKEKGVCFMYHSTFDSWTFAEYKGNHLNQDPCVGAMVNDLGTSGNRGLYW